MADIINGNPHAGNQTPIETEVNLDKMTIKEKCNKILDILKPWSQKLSATGNDDGSITIKPGHGRPNITIMYPPGVGFVVNEMDNSIDFIYYDEQLGDYRLYATWSFDSNGNLTVTPGNTGGIQYTSFNDDKENHKIIVTKNDGTTEVLEYGDKPVYYYPITDTDGNVTGHWVNIGGHSDEGGEWHYYDA